MAKGFCMVYYFYMKKIFFFVGGLFLVAILGRALWAYQQMQNNKAETQIPQSSEDSKKEISVATTTTKILVKTEAFLSDAKKQELIDRALQKISILSDEEKRSLATELVVRMYKTPKIPLSDEEEVLMNELSKNLDGKPISDVEIKYMIIQEVNGRVNGISVPPAPNRVVNEATLAGIDTNVNGIRDDVERVIAQKFGAKKEMYDFLMKDAKLLQAAIIEKQPPEMSEEEQLRLMKSGIDNPSFGVASQAFSAFLGCIEDNDKLDAMNLVDYATTNTGMRAAAYGNAFAGAVTSSEHCPK